MNNSKLYTRILGKFRDGQGDFRALFAAAQSDADPSAAERAAHSLRGTAGNIGARGVQAAAGELERACHDGADAATIERLLATTLTALAPVIEGLRQVGAGETATSAISAATTAAAAAPVLSKPDLNARLDQLAELLEQSNTASGELLSELLEQLGGDPLVAALKPVSDAISDFDFDIALEQLILLRSALPE